MGQARTLSNEELAILLRRCKERDESAWEDVFRCLYGLIKHCVLRAGLRDEDVDDAISESFMRMIHSIDDVASAKNQLGYIGALARYTAFGMRKKHSRLDDQRVDVSGDPDDETDGLERIASDPSTQRSGIMLENTREQIKSLLKKLKSGEVELVRLKYIEDYCYDELAYILDKPVGALRVATHRAVKKLADHATSEAKDVIRENPELLYQLNLSDLDGFARSEPDEGLRRLLEDYVAAEEDLSADALKKVEAMLAEDAQIREYKVRLERMLPIDLDVVGHGPEDQIPAPMLDRLMLEVKNGAGPV